MNPYLFTFYHLADISVSVYHQFPPNVINELVFNPFNENNNSEAVDSCFLENTVKEINCNYNFSGELRTILQHDSLNIMFYNISSVPLHFESFTEQCINSSDIHPDVFVLCETRLNNNISSLYSLVSYNVYFQNKKYGRWWFGVVFT